MGRIVLTDSYLKVGVLEQVRDILVDALQLDTESRDLIEDSLLIGNLTELDSLSVLAVITALEEHFQFVVDDDEDMSEAFETLGSLTEYVEKKLLA